MAQILNLDDVLFDRSSSPHHKFQQKPSSHVTIADPFATDELSSSSNLKAKFNDKNILRQSNSLSPSVVKNKKSSDKYTTSGGSYIDSMTP